MGNGSQNISPDEILLREYAQAGEITRADQRTAQTAFQIFWVFATALGAFLAKERGLESLVFALLCLAGVALGISTICLLWRLSNYTRVYMRRARVIEKILGMKLYSFGYRAVSEKGLSNKKVLVALVLVAVVAFLVPLVIVVPEILSQWCECVGKPNNQ